MSIRFGSLLHSLGFRLLVSLVLVVAAVLSIYALITFSSTRRHVLDLMHDQVDRSSALIQRATYEDMLLNRKGEVQEMIARLVGRSGVDSIRIYDKEGRIAFSSDVEEIGDAIALDERPCLSCHPESERPGPDSVTDTVIDLGAGAEHFWHVEMVPNEPACSSAGCHAHRADAAALGVLEVRLSTAPLDETLGAARRQLLSTTIGLLVVIGAVVAIFIRQQVHRPLAQLQRGTQRLARGQLDTRIEIQGRHELARLGEAFNRMAADLDAANREITSWSQQLEQKVVQKTEELQRAQRQVLHMEKMASLGKLSATVAHELNNPLSGILTYARLVERELADQPLKSEVREELQGYLRFMSRECGRCGEIVKNLLAFAKRSGAKMTEVDLNEIVERSLMLVRHHLDLSGVRLEKRLLDRHSVIHADPGQLQQALVALMVNAIEAMSGPAQDDPCLEVRLEGEEEHVRIFLRDNGVGIPADALPQIFEPFYSSKDGESGVGLGLAVVYGIVRRHQGTIDVESEIGAGTTFHVCLPRRPETHREASS